MARVDINLSGAKAKMSEGSVQRGRYALANQALADMNQYVPMQEGVLRLSASIDLDGSAINYNTPYASRLFYYHMYNYTTPGTGPRWDLKAQSQHMRDWENAFMKGAGW